MPTSQKIKVKYDVFKWLYTTSGYDEKEILDKTSIGLKDWGEWINNKRDIELPLSTIKKLAEAYNRPITAFLISKPPEDKIIPKDFRNEPEDKKYSKELHRLFIKAHRKLELFVEMAENINAPSKPEHPAYSTKDSPFETAEKERRRLNIDSLKIEPNGNTSYKQWREYFASIGIPVFQYNMDKDRVRGFVTKTKDSSAIIVNSGDNPNGRIFTILHEYAHILTNTDAVCTDDGTESKDKNIRETELWCDNFAGAFLIPEKIITENETIQTLINTKNITKLETEISKLTSASKSAVLVRLNVLGILTQTEIKPELSRLKKSAIKRKQTETISEEEEDETENTLDKTKETKKGGGPDRAELSVRELGESYINLVNKNYDNGHITYTTLLENIGISKNSHERLKKKGVIQ